MAIQSEELSEYIVLESGVWGKELRIAVLAAANFALLAHLNKRTLGRFAAIPGRTPHLQLVEKGVRLLNYDSGLPIFRVEVLQLFGKLRVTLTTENWGGRRKIWITENPSRSASDYEHVWINRGLKWVTSILPEIWNTLGEWRFGVTNQNTFMGDPNLKWKVGNMFSIMRGQDDVFSGGRYDSTRVTPSITIAGMTYSGKTHCVRTSIEDGEDNRINGYTMTVVSGRSLNPFRRIVTSVVPLGNSESELHSVGRLHEHELKQLFGTK